MSNNLLTISMITNEALMVLENELTFSSEVDRNYDDQFAVSGAKIGNTLNVRRPGRFIGTTGPALNVEDFNETSVPVTLTTQFHVDTQFTTQDLALSLDMFSDRVLKPAVAAVATKRLKNFTQILKKVVSVSGTARAVKTYGRADEFEYQLSKRMKELKRDLEFAAVTNQGGTAGAAASAPLMASVESWIATNAVSVQEGTAGTTHGATTGAFPTRGPIDSTSAGSLTEAALKNAINLAWNAGGDPKVLMASGKVKQKISGGFTGVATRFRNVNAGAQAEIISGVDLYVSDFGEHQLIPNRFMRTSVLLVLDMDYWAVASLRNFTMERLAKNGDADVAHIVGEYCIESRNEKASAKVADIDPAK